MRRFAASPRLAAGVFVLLFGVTASAREQDRLGGVDRPSSAGVDRPTSVAPASTLLASLPTATLAQLSVPAPQPVRLGAPEPARRPNSLVPLYVSFASLQVLDIHSTTRALDRGAVEANPLMQGVAGNPLALSTVKIAGAAGLVYAAEKMWRKNRRAAVIFMVAANAGMAFVVHHNYRAVR
jgi:hypothetical protein